MSMRVLSNQFQALAQSSIRSASQNYEKSAERLATGKRINSASDNAAASAISLKMTAEIKTSEQAFRNLNDSISLLQTFEGSARSIVDIMGRMRQLAVAIGNQTLSTGDSTNLASEYLGLRAEVARIAKSTDWNGMNLYNGTLGTNGKIDISTGDSSIEVDLGTSYKLVTQSVTRVAGTGVGNTNGSSLYQLEIPNVNDLQAGDVINFLLYSNNQSHMYTFRLSQAEIDILKTNSTSVIDDEPQYISNAGTLSNYTITLSGSTTPGVLNVQLAHPSRADWYFALDSSITADTTIHPNITRGDLAFLSGLYPIAPHGSGQTIVAIDKAINSFTQKIAKVGSSINRLESAITNELSKKQSVIQSQSRIIDTNYATETTALARSQIITRASINMHSIGSQAKRIVLTLLDS